jgi:hypothetical protein
VPAPSGRALRAQRERSPEHSAHCGIAHPLRREEPAGDGSTARAALHPQHPVVGLGQPPTPRGELLVEQQHPAVGRNGVEATRGDDARPRLDGEGMVGIDHLPDPVRLKYRRNGEPCCSLKQVRRRRARGLR